MRFIFSFLRLFLFDNTIKNVNILCLTADKDFLECLPVTIKGEIMEKGKNTTDSKAETLIMQIKNKEKQVAKKKAEKEKLTKAALMSERSIFEDDSGGDNSEAEPDALNKTIESNSEDTDPELSELRSAAINETPEEKIKRLEREIEQLRKSKDRARIPESIASTSTANKVIDCLYFI